MTLKDLKGLKYFIAYGLAVLGFFVYSSMVGWRWFNPTTTEHTRSEAHHSGGGSHGHYYHK